MHSNLPRRPLADLDGGAETIVLCPTARLASGLRRAHGNAQSARGLTVWTALNSATPAQWLDHLVSSALLRGEVPAAAASGRFLTRPQERCLWERAIAVDEKIAGGELFDRAGMALAAIEAESLRIAWHIDVPKAMQTDEYRAFLRWRAGLSELCQAGAWRTSIEAMVWRIDCVNRGIEGLPKQLGIAGFVAPDPMLSRLLKVLETRGVELFQADISVRPATFSDADADADADAGPGMVFTCLDAEEECIAAAAWVKQRLTQEPSRKFRIAVADWPSRRRLLEAALDEALHPEAVGAGWATLERVYTAVSGGELAEESGVATAMRLLQLFAHPRRVAQGDFGAMLCAPGWSADISEADARACLDAALRECLPPEISLIRLQRAVQREAATTSIPRLVEHLDALVNVQRKLPARQLPGVWGGCFVDLLAALAWPGQRVQTAAEQAANEQFVDLLAGLTTLDSLLGQIEAGTALRLVRQMARDQSFVAPRRISPVVEICGLADALSGPVDGLWLMGMNEGAWPRPPKPNPLLPADLQRHAGIPASRCDSLADEARALQKLWQESATEVVFSWASREGERVLRASPLLAGLPLIAAAENEPVTSVVFERLERLDDSLAPPVVDGERVRGGTSLLQAQAVCPAWGFYQYRLGAAVLPAPTFALNARVRGGLLHGALEAFWRQRGLVELQGMDLAMRAREIDLAVNASLAKFNSTAMDELAPRLALLEAERLRTLMAIWLDVEAQRSNFRVIACEERQTLEIEGLPVRVVIDRVDELDDGRLVVIDYKSGRSVSVTSWADLRPSEPQLPIYASLAFPDRAVAAVALARVVADEPAFLGVAEIDGLLPGVNALEGQRLRYAEDEFPDWESLRRLWGERIAEIAREVRNGCAAVVFSDEKAIQFCAVKPLLRVAERTAQWEDQS